MTGFRCPESRVCRGSARRDHISYLSRYVRLDRGKGSVNYFRRGILLRIKLLIITLDGTLTDVQSCVSTERTLVLDLIAKMTFSGL